MQAPFFFFFCSLWHYWHLKWVFDSEAFGGFYLVSVRFFLVRVIETQDDWANWSAFFTAEQQKATLIYLCECKVIISRDVIWLLSRPGVESMAQLCVMLPPWVVVCFMFYSLFLFQTKKKALFFPVVFCSNPHIRHTFFPLPANQDFTFSKKLCHLWGGGFHLAFEVFRVLFLSFLSILGCQEALPWQALLLLFLYDWKRQFKTGPGGAEK